MRRFLNARRQWSLGKRLEIKQTRVAPNNSIALLDGQLLRDCFMPLGIDLALQTVPLNASRAHPIDTALVMHGHLVPQSSPGSHSMVPRHMMKPQQVPFLARVHVRELIADRMMILI